MKVMIVEDERIISLHLERVLDKLGHEVVSVTDRAEEVLVLAERSHPDVILMDIFLKGEMDGVEAARLVADSLALPVIFTTGNSDESTKGRALALRPVRYLDKPLSKEALSSALDSVGKK